MLRVCLIMKKLDYKECLEIIDEHGDSELLLGRLKNLDLSVEQIGNILQILESTCNYCWNVDDSVSSCHCMWDD